MLFKQTPRADQPATHAGERPSSTKLPPLPAAAPAAAGDRSGRPAGAPGPVLARRRRDREAADRRPGHPAQGRDHRLRAADRRGPGRGHDECDPRARDQAVRPFHRQLRGRGRRDQRRLRGRSVGARPADRAHGRQGGRQDRLWRARTRARRRDRGRTQRPQPPARPGRRRPRAGPDPASAASSPPDRPAGRRARPPIERRLPIRPEPSRRALFRRRRTG